MGDAGHGVGCARPQRRQCHGGPSCHPRHGIGHEDGGRFVVHQFKAHTAPSQRLQHFHSFAAGHTKRKTHPSGEDVVNESFGYSRHEGILIYDLRLTIYDCLVGGANSRLDCFFVNIETFQRRTH